MNKIDFQPLYYQAKEQVFRDTQYFMQKLKIDLTQENIELSRQFSEQIMNIHNEIVRQHKWAFDELVKSLEKSCEPTPINLQEVNSEK